MNGYRSLEEQKRIWDEYSRTGNRSVFGEAWNAAPVVRLTVEQLLSELMGGPRSTHSFGFASDEKETNE